MTSGLSRSILSPGTRICGAYVVDRFVRHGPLASVYLARREGESAARYEVRVVHRELAQRGAPAAVIERALDRLKSLQHRGIPPVVAVGVEAQGPAVVSEYPGGATLRELLTRGERPAGVELERVCAAVAAVLDDLHRRQPPVVHRGLCPENVVLERDGRVWVEEAGLVHALAEASLLPGQGTPPGMQGYVSPDDLLHRAHPRTDVFVLASIVYECLTGQRAYKGASPAVLERAVLRGKRPSVVEARPELPASVDEVLGRAWSTDAASAYPSASAFVVDLARALAVPVRTPVSATAAPAAAPALPAASSAAPAEAEDEIDRAFDAMLSDGPDDTEPSPPPATAAPPSRTPPLPSARPAPAPTPAAPAPVAPAAPAPTPAAPAPAPTPAAYAPVAPARPAPAAPAASMAPRPAGAAPRPTAPSTPPERRPSAPSAPPVAPAAVRAALSTEAPPLASSRPVGAVGVSATRPVQVPNLRRAGSGLPPAPGTRPATGSERAQPIREDPRAEHEDSWEPLLVDAPRPTPDVRPARGSAPSAEPPLPPARRESAPTEEAAPKPAASAPRATPSVEPLPVDLAADVEIPVADDDFDRTASPPDAPAPSSAAGSPPLPPFAPPPAPAAPPPPPVVAVGSERVSAPPAPPPFASPPVASAPPPPVMRAPVSAPPAGVPVASWAPPSPPVAYPPAPPPNDRALAVRVVKILGGAIVLAALIVTAGQVYLAQLEKPQGPVRVVRVMVPARATSAVAATAAPSTHVVPAPPSPVAPAPSPAQPVADAAVAAAPVPAVDAGSEPRALGLAPGEGPAAGDAGAATEVLAGHPGPDAVEAATRRLLPAVRRCVSGRGGRRVVRVSVRYDGDDGRPTRIDVHGSYDRRPTGPCVVAAVRGHSMPRFSDDRWEMDYVFPVR